MASELFLDSKTRPDLYIALVGAAGTDLERVKIQLKAHLASFDYAYEEVKVSRLIGEFCELNLSDVEEDVRIKQLMDGGDQIRAAHGGGDGVVSLIVNFIKQGRSKSEEPATGLLGSTAFVIDSLKNPEEIQTLNKIYGRNFYTVSVYAAEGERELRLANRIAESCHTPTRKVHRKRAQKVIREDERRDATALSQDVQNTFPKADFFLEAGEAEEVHIKRFIDLVFGEPFTTPTFDEYAMFMARAASLRSCDLSRQVGAAIFSPSLAIISTGYNEVPYPTGGAWFEGRKGDEWRSLTIDARVRNLIEFGRVVHAEMHAISEAARFGRSVDAATLFCTTFPCHICARHIIAAGIVEVVFIEPYPKSLTKILYEREISTDDKKGSLPNPVVFRPFQGVSPVLYQRVFSFRPRKNKSGTIARFKRGDAVPVGAVFGVSNLLLERSVSTWIEAIKTQISVPSEVGAAVAE